MDISNVFTGVTWWGVGLSLIFGVFWLAILHPFRLNSGMPWLMLIAGAILFAPALFYIYTPLQNLFGGWLIGLDGQDIYIRQLLWRGIPFILLGALVQEGVKMAPLVIHWRYQGKKVEPLIGLTLGAMVGVGFGLIEAQWMNNVILGSGWTMENIRAGGIIALAGFWNNFFTLGFNISLSAICGWGLARGWGWQTWLIASLVHALLNYSALLIQKQLLTVLGFEIIIAVGTILVFGLVYWLHKRESAPKPQPEFQEAGPEAG